MASDLTGDDWAYDLPEEEYDQLVRDLRAKYREAMEQGRRKEAQKLQRRIRELTRRRSKRAHQNEGGGQ